MISMIGVLPPAIAPDHEQRRDPHRERFHVRYDPEFRPLATRGRGKGREVMEGMQELARVLQRAAEGDETAFRWLYRGYRRGVVRLCAAFAALDADEVEDVVQETFVRAFKRVAQLKEPAAFEPWLYTIARNRALTAIEKKSNAAKAREELQREDPPPSELVPQALKQEAAAEVVREVIASLPEGPEKHTAQLFYVDGELTAREIAEREGVGKSAVTMRLERFRARVKRVLLRRLLETKWAT
jgi:RNA polymerase sigma-70 factor (ECF subfamily)